MLLYTVVTKEFHFDNYEESKENRLLYVENGYRVCSYGSEDDWYFIAEIRMETEWRRLKYEI